MGTWLRTMSDPDLGAIAEVVDEESGDVIASCAASPRSSDGMWMIVDESQIFQHGHLLPADVWDAAVRGTQT